MESETIVDRIRALANAQGLSLPALEVKLNLGNGTISRWSKSSPNTDKLVRVADFFHVSLDYLLDRPENNRQPINYDGLSDVKKEFLQFVNDVDDEQVRLALRVLKSVWAEL